MRSSFWRVGVSCLLVQSITPAHGGAHLGKWAYIVIFGGVQIFLSMVSGMAYHQQL